MEYRYLGRTGMRVSELCLGAMTFGRETPEDESYDLMDRFFDAGGNFIDTANVYGRGTSETIVGRWLEQQHREDLVIATKVFGAMGDGPNDRGLSRKHIMASVEDSLRRLNTDYIDLYQIHSWDENTPLEETLDALNTLVQDGKVRYIGASNVTGWQLQRAVDLSCERGWEPFACLQPLYNLLDRAVEWELLPVCANEGIGVIPWSPLRGGWLSGKYYRGMESPPSGTRVEEASKRGWSESWEAYGNERTWTILDELFEIADKTDKTPAQVALRWLLEQDAVTAPITGVRTMKHLEDNLGATGWSLTEDQLAKLDEVSEPDAPYPY
jgi:aryl-alcohol dehydrogenase-like predicted oxidoreductase